MIDDAIDLIFCTNVNSSCRFIQYQNIRICKHPFCKKYFLLIATAQVSNILFYRRTFCFQFFFVVNCHIIFFILIDHSMAADCIQIGKCGIDLDRVAQDQTISLSVLRNIGKLVLDRFLYVVQMDFLSIDI